MSLLAIFRDELKKCMFEQNLTLSELAKISGVSKGQISKYMKGDNSPSLDVLERISNALGIKATQLIGEPNKQKLTFAQTKAFLDLWDAFDLHDKFTAKKNREPEIKCETLTGKDGTPKAYTVDVEGEGFILKADSRGFPIFTKMFVKTVTDLGVKPEEIKDYFPASLGL
ncbi:MAG: helix-turn-helix domain-containing protein [Bacteriovoracaceae bacterium]